MKKKLEPPGSDEYRNRVNERIHEMLREGRKNGKIDENHFHYWTNDGYSPVVVHVLDIRSEEE